MAQLTASSEAWYKRCQCKGERGKAMSHFPEVLGTVTVFFFLTLLPVSAILAAVLSKQIVTKSLAAPRTTGKK